MSVPPRGGGIPAPGPAEPDAAPIPSDRGTWRPLRDGEAARADGICSSDPRSGFMQSSFWAEFKRAEGYEVTRLALESEGGVEGIASLLLYPLSGPSGFVQSGFVLCPEGPVIPWDDVPHARQALRDLTDVVKETTGAVGLRIEPHLPMPAPSLLRNWMRAPTDLTPADTLTLDLTLSEPEFLRQAHPKCRYNLGLADRHGVEVESVRDIRFAHDFYELLLDNSNRAGFYVEPFGFFLNLLSTVFAHDAGEVFVARYRGRMLAANLVVYYGRRATYLYGASSSEDRNVMPVYPLHRAAMNAAKARGCLEYDLYGIDAFERRDHLYAGITRFKKQWGGTVERRIGARDYIYYDRLADLVVENLMPA